MGLESWLKDIKLWLFDIDMTLVDSSSPHVAAYNPILKEYGKEPIDEKFFIENCMGLTDIKIFRDIFKLSQSEAEEAVKKYNKAYSNYIDLIEVYTGAPELLKFLDDNDYKIGIITTLFEENAEASVERILEEGRIDRSVYDFFGSIRHFDNSTKPKPNPDPVLEAIDETNERYNMIIKPDEVVVVGDSVNDMLSGKTAGTKTIGVMTRGGKEIFKNLADNVVNNINDLYHLIIHYYDTKIN